MSSAFYFWLGWLVGITFQNFSLLFWRWLLKEDS